MGYMGSAWATLVCYAGMMSVSYFLGNRHYPVNYDLKRILGYLSLSLLLFAFSQRIKIESYLFDLVTKNLLFVLFVSIVFIFERKNLFEKKNEDQSYQ